MKSNYLIKRLLLGFLIPATSFNSSWYSRERLKEYGRNAADTAYRYKESAIQAVRNNPGKTAGAALVGVGVILTVSQKARTRVKQAWTWAKDKWNNRPDLLKTKEQIRKEKERIRKETQAKNEAARAKLEGLEKSLNELKKKNLLFPEYDGEMVFLEQEIRKAKLKEYIDIMGTKDNPQSVERRATLRKQLAPTNPEREKLDYDIDSYNTLREMSSRSPSQEAEFQKLKKKYDS